MKLLKTFFIKLIPILVSSVLCCILAFELEDKKEDMLMFAPPPYEYMSSFPFSHDSHFILLDRYIYDII